MSVNETGSPSEVAWARRVNDGWIVHHGLRESATAYLDHLETSDPDRLRRSCACARELMQVREHTEDPKPWFYAGLFSQVRPAEAERFLADHWFTASCLPSLATSLGERILPKGIGSEARAKSARIRQAIRTLHRRPDSPDG